MRQTNYLFNSYEDRLKRQVQKFRWYSLHLDPYLLLAILTLNFYGSIILYSASNSNLSMLLHQQLHFICGMLIMLLMAQIPPNLFKLSAKWLYVASILLIAAVLLIGKLGGGAQRWISVGIFNIQPSEIMKFIIPIALANYLSAAPIPLKLKSVAVCSCLLIIPCMLIILEPDLGTAIVVAISGSIMLLLAGIPKRYFAWGGLALVTCAPFLWHGLHFYQKQRILTFLNPERNPLGSGYHIIQSEIAVGSGHWLGKGWLHGTQSHLQFLPTHTTDFIFSVLGEEFGFIGTLLLLAIYLIIWLRCIYLSMRVEDTFSRLLGTCLSFVFFISAMINIGMAIGIVPVVGIPLPLVSYGGSSMIINLLVFGVIMSLTTRLHTTSSTLK